MKTNILKEVTTPFQRYLLKEKIVRNNEEKRTIKYFYVKSNSKIEVKENISEIEFDNYVKKDTEKRKKQFKNYNFSELYKTIIVKDVKGDLYIYVNGYFINEKNCLSFKDVKIIKMYYSDLKGFQALKNYKEL